MITIERKIKGDFVIIGWIDNVGPCEWLWTCFDDKVDEYNVHTQGCATSRQDAESDVRKDYRELITPC